MESARKRDGCTVLLYSVVSRAKLNTDRARKSAGVVDEFGRTIRSIQKKKSIQTPNIYARA